jgi:hypothetical protein
MLRVGELTEQGMLTASIRPRNALRLKGLVTLLLGLAALTAGAAGSLTFSQQRRDRTDTPNRGALIRSPHSRARRHSCR